MAALLEFGIYHPARLFAFSSRLRASLSNDVSVGAGEATYGHSIPSLALRQRHGLKSFAFDLHQEVALVITRATGRGFDKNYSATTTVPAVGGGTKLEYLLGERFSLWCDVTWLMALGNDNLLGSDAFGSDVSRGLPRQHLWAAIGVGGLL